MNIDEIEAKAWEWWAASKALEAATAWWRTARDHERIVRGFTLDAIPVGRSLGTDGPGD